MRAKRFDEEVLNDMPFKKRKAPRIGAFLFFTMKQLFVYTGNVLL